MTSIEFLNYLRPKAIALATSVLGNKQDAAEVVQDSLLKVVSSRALPARETELIAWFYKVVRNGAIDQLRKNQTAKDFVLASGSSEQQPVSNSPGQTLERQEQEGRVFAVLSQLPLDYRDILVLKEVNGMSYQQLSEILEIPKGTVMSRLHRARMHFTNAYQQTDSDNVYGQPGEQTYDR